MIEKSTAIGYAQALFDLASNNQLVEQIETELEGINNLLVENKDLERLLLHPGVPRQEKKRLLNLALTPACSPLLKKFLYFVIDKRRDRILRLLLDSYRSVIRKAKGIVIANVQSAIKLGDDRIDRLKTALERLIGKKVEIKTTINQKILGGLIIRIEDRLIDGSVWNQLLNLKKKMLNSIRG